jgi:hypothetical protein
VVKYLPSKYEALNSNPNTAKKELKLAPQRDISIPALTKELFTIPKICKKPKYPSKIQ